MNVPPHHVPVVFLAQITKMPPASEEKTRTTIETSHFFFLILPTPHFRSLRHVIS